MSRSGPIKNPKPSNLLCQKANISIAKMERSCGEVSGLLRSLSHPGRLLILGHLLRGPKTVSELEGLCQISQSQLSQFLARMKLEKLVTSQREGRFQNYQVTDVRVAELIQAIQNIFCH